MKCRGTFLTADLTRDRTKISTFAGNFHKNHLDTPDCETIYLLSLEMQDHIFTVLGFLCLARLKGRHTCKAASESCMLAGNALQFGLRFPQSQAGL